MSVVAFALPKLLREVDGVPVAAQVVPVTGVADGRPDAILLPSENEVPDARVGNDSRPLDRLMPHKRRQGQLVPSITRAILRQH